MMSSAAGSAVCHWLCLTYASGCRHTHWVATVGERYQVVIERDVRLELGVNPGDRAVETVENGRLVITFLPARHRRSLLGILAGPGPAADPLAERDEMADMLAREDAERRR
jgi:bifunctional DNA-binding transcriptional regulator/antitoxin component of YhaV-PrlF toxin-antitoxin module